MTMGEFSMKVVVIAGSAYGTNQKGLDEIINTARKQIPFGIYAVEKDSVIELRNDKFRDLDELKRQVSEFREKGFKVYYNS